MSLETSKAMHRRWREESVPWWKYFSGRGIDVGSGDDPLSKDPNIMGRALAFDRDDGDANHLSRHVISFFDFIHASQVLEHMHDPAAALRDWLTVVKPGGYIIVTVPDWVAYEGMVWPSRWNSDHKSTWSMIYRGSTAPQHIYIPEFLSGLAAAASVELARFVDTNYDYTVGTTRDQTLASEDRVECWNEFVLRRR